MLSVAVVPPGKAEYVAPHAITTGHVNSDNELQALVRTDRLPRSWKTLKLAPGKVYRWYYSWILQDGSTVTKVETKPIKGIQDDRPFEESHPNLSATCRVGTCLAGPIGGVVGGLISK